MRAVHVQGAGCAFGRCWAVQQAVLCSCCGGIWRGYIVARACVSLLLLQVCQLCGCLPAGQGLHKQISNAPHPNVCCRWAQSSTSRLSTCWRQCRLQLAALLLQALLPRWVLGGQGVGLPPLSWCCCMWIRRVAQRCNDLLASPTSLQGHTSNHPPCTHPLPAGLWRLLPQCVARASRPHVPAWLQPGFPRRQLCVQGRRVCFHR